MLGQPPREGRTDDQCMAVTAACTRASRQRSQEKRVKTQPSSRQARRGGYSSRWRAEPSEFHAPVLSPYSSRHNQFPRYIDAFALQRAIGNRQTSRLLRLCSPSPSFLSQSPSIRPALRLMRELGGSHAPLQRITEEELKNRAPEGRLRRQQALYLQRITEEELKNRGKKIREMAKSAPERGVNLWMASRNGAIVYLLGTEHRRKLAEVGADASMRQYLIKFLTVENFTQVYTEKVEEIPFIKHDANLSAQLERFIEVKKSVENDLNESEDSSKYKRAVAKLNNARTGGLHDILKISLDQAYLSLATSGKQVERRGLETDETRLKATEINVRDMKIAKGDPEKKLYNPEKKSDPSDNSFQVGDQKRLFNEVADEMESGRDIASAEERNRQWIDILQAIMADAQQIKQLWIVGAAHLPGLILRLQELQWEVKHQAPPSL
jgi:hypothetical protein